MKSDIPAVLFCGGYSNRMGTPKHLLKINGQYLWQYQLKKLTKAFNEVYISCREEQKADFRGQNLILDKVYDIGPIAGIIAALDYHCGKDIFILSVDTLGVSLETMLKIGEENSSKSLASVAVSNETNRFQPLIARWNHSSKDQLLAFIQIGQHSPTRFLEHVSYNKIVVHEEELMNINTQKDFEEYLSRI